MQFIKKISLIGLMLKFLTCQTFGKSEVGQKTCQCGKIFLPLRATPKFHYQGNRITRFIGLKYEAQKVPKH
jgi:hypothetical protein